MPSTATLPWHWAIEALADLKQADTSLLRALIARVPDFWTDASEPVRERLALRYLEECSASGRADAPSTTASGRGIDAAARSSEEVLCSHLRKVATLGSLEKGEAELSSLDLHQFTLQKRAALPKSSLDMLKESILEGRCQALSSLKESSGLSRPSQVDYLQHSNDGEHERVKKLKYSTGDGEMHSRIQGSVTLTPDSGNLNLQEEPSGSEKDLPKQNVSDGDTRNHLNRNIGSTGGNDVQLLEKGSIRQLPSEKSIGLNDSEIQSLNQAAAPALDSGSVGLQDPSASCQHLPERNVSDCEMRSNVQFSRQSSPPQPPCKENISFQHTPLNGSRKNVNQPLYKNVHFDGELSIVSETPSDGGGSDDVPSNFDPNDEMFTTEKHRLLSSQIHANHDSIASDWSEQGLCIKCDKGGQLLSCSARGCLIAVHESCLGTSVKFKETGLFYCPFCSYTRAAIVYCKARKSVFRARKSLSAFIGRDLAQGHRKKLRPASIPGETSHSGVAGNMNHQHSFHSHEYQRNKSNGNSLKAREQHHQTEAANGCYKGNSSNRYPEAPPSVGRCDVFHNVAEQSHDVTVNDHQDIPQVQQHLNDAANIMNNGKLPCGDKVTAPICENADVTLINRESEVGNDCEYNGVVEHQHLAQPHATTDNGNLPHEEVDAYQIRYRDVSRAKQKDGIGLVNDCMHVEKLKNQDQIRAASDHDIGRESHPTKRHAKRIRCDAATSKIHHPQETVENPKREKSSPGSSSKHAVLRNQEQVRAAPDHDNDQEVLNPQPSERRSKRRRHDVAIGKIYHPQETVENPNRDKSSSGSCSKRVAQTKHYFNQRIILGRREKLFWTSEEEETLKDAVQRFGVDSDGNYPWTKILEFGRRVFHITRQPGDLKDKWRNIRKKEVKQEM